MKTQTIDDVLLKLPYVQAQLLDTPVFHKNENTKCIGLAVESMKRHMTDEGWQIFDGLSRNGYELFGHNIGDSLVHVPTILEASNPGTVLLQDKREWHVRDRRDFREREACFTNYKTLSNRHGIFKLTILKDSHQKLNYHRESAEEIGCHAWIIYYHPRIVKYLAPYVREQHLIRTYHSLDADNLPPFEIDRTNLALISGAVSNVYPLRKKIIAGWRQIPGLWYVKHPGYHRNGSHTPGYVRSLQKYKVAICTSSIYGYSLRKIIESVASGCTVITDLPTDEILPEIDQALIRISPDISELELRDVVLDCYKSWDPDQRKIYAGKAASYYDYRNIGKILSADIQQMRSNY